jgi:hypothetical protein
MNDDRRSDGVTGEYPDGWNSNNTFLDYHRLDKQFLTGMWTGYRLAAQEFSLWSVLDS